MLEREWDYLSGSARNCRYRIKCDICGEPYKHEVKKRLVPMEWTNNLEPDLTAVVDGWIVEADMAICKGCQKTIGGGN